MGFSWLLFGWPDDRFGQSDVSSQSSKSPWRLPLAASANPAGARLLAPDLLSSSSASLGMRWKVWDQSPKFLSDGEGNCEQARSEKLTVTAAKDGIFDACQGTVFASLEPLDESSCIVGRLSFVGGCHDDHRRSLG